MKKDNSILSIYDKGNFPVGTLNIMGFPVSSVGKESACNAGDLCQEGPLEKGKAAYSSILA